MKLKIYDKAIETENFKQSIETVYNLYRSIKIDSFRKLEEIEVENGFPCAPVYIYAKKVNDDIIGIGKIRNNLLKREIIY